RLALRPDRVRADLRRDDHRERGALRRARRLAGRPGDGRRRAGRAPRRAASRGGGVKSLHVAIGAVLGVTGGPATYARELIAALHALDALQEIDDSLELSILTDRPDLIDVPRARVVEIALPSPWAQPFWDNVAIPRELR